MELGPAPPVGELLDTSPPTTTPAAQTETAYRGAVGSAGAVVITKVVNGWRPAGLPAHLLGPGTAEVHQAPRVTASWEGLDACECGEHRHRL
jgi:hypothetical protein